LTKNPKKRPSADKLLEHVFLVGDFTKRYGKELLDLFLNGPSTSNFLATQEDDDEPEILLNAPRRISNKKPNDESSNKKNQQQQQQSTANSSSNHLNDIMKNGNSK
jgi:hypothetical protein